MKNSLKKYGGILVLKIKRQDSCDPGLVIRVFGHVAKEHRCASMRWKSPAWCRRHELATFEPATAGTEGAKHCLNTGERSIKMTKKTMKEMYAQLGGGLSLHDDLVAQSKPEEEIKGANECNVEQQAGEQQSEQEGKPPVSDGCGPAGDEERETNDGADLTS